MTYDEISPLLPDFFEAKLSEKYSEEDVRRIVCGCDSHRATTLRANTLLSNKEEIAAALRGLGITWNEVPWYENAFQLDITDARPLWDLPEYKAGKMYLQSLSSMLPPIVLGVQAGEDVLDMCAAPGGKTTEIAALCPKCHITATELNVPRAEKLEYNLNKQGARNVMVMRVDARNLDEFFRFDRILLDAPCSGSGTLRANDPKLPKRFTEKLVQKSVKSQRALLSKALQVVKPGGTILYSTCSVLECENEEAVRSCLAKASKMGKYEIQEISFPGMENVPTLPSTLEGAVTVCPTDTYEGFFMCLIKRTK